MGVNKDGTGTGNLQKIDHHHRAHTLSVNHTGKLDASFSGKAFNLNTKLISITGNSALIYLSNTSSEAFVIDELVIAIFDGITYTDFPYILVHKNPTTGDLLTDKTDAPIIQNKNMSAVASSTLSGVCYKGKDGGTVGGGTEVGLFLINKTGRTPLLDIDFVLEKNSSIAIELILNGTGTANVYAAIGGHYTDKGE